MTQWKILPTFIFLFHAGTLLGEKVYRHSFVGTPVTLDPIAYSDVYANKIAVAIYDCLYQYKYLKSPLELKPQLAKSMPIVSADSRTLTIPIKRGVFFADDPAFPNGKGRELIAEDFVYSIKRHFDPKNVSSNKWLWADKILGLDEWGKSGGDYSKTIPGLLALDRYTVQIKFKSAYPQFVHTLALGTAAVVPKEAVDYYGKSLSIHPVGSGPWKLQSFDNRKAVLVKNANFRKEAFDPVEEGYDAKLHSYTGVHKLKGKFPPFVDRVEIYFLEQESSLWNSFSKGSEIQFATVPNLQFDAIMKDKGAVVTLKEPYASKYKVSKELESSYLYFGFNMENPDIGHNADPVRNKKNKALRCAIRKGFNWKQIIDRMYHGIGEPFPGIVPPHIIGYDKTLSRETITLDVEGAKRLLKENGWNASNLPVLRYSGVSTVSNKQLYEFFKSWMLKIGYPAQKLRFDMSSQFGDYAQSLREKKLMSFYIAWSFDFPDAQNSFQLYYGPNSSPGSNLANYRNAEYDALFEKAADLMHGEERAKIYRRMTEILMDDCAVVSGYSRTRAHLWHKNVIIFPREFSNSDYYRFIDLDG